MDFLNNLLQEDDVVLEKSTLLFITDRTVKFGDNVYQFRNVTGFGVGQLKNKNIVPLKVIFFLGLIGLFFIYSSNYPWGVFIILLGLGGLHLNNSQPEKYGLELSLNSGQRKLFVTTDRQFIKEVVFTLYEFMERNEEGTYIVNIQDKSIRIEGSVGGSVTAGDIKGSLSSHVGRDVSKE